MNETTDIAPGIYRDRDGDVWAITSDQRALQLSQASAARVPGYEGGALPSEQIAVQARFGLNDARTLARHFAPLTPLHIFEEVAA